MTDIDSYVKLLPYQISYKEDSAPFPFPDNGRYDRAGLQ